MTYRTRFIYTVLAWAAPTLVVAQQGDTVSNDPAAKFDGKWNVTLACPPQDGVKSFTHRFAAEVKNGQLRGLYGTEGEPGYHLLQGGIATDGMASMKLDGMIINPETSTNQRPRGERYSYRVTAKFDQATGSGHRASKRPCDFQFSRQ